MRFLTLFLALSWMLPGCLATSKVGQTVRLAQEESLSTVSNAGMTDPNVDAPASTLAARSSHRIALVIGNKDYAQAPLKNPIHDASDIRTALEAVGFDVIYRENADITTMNQAVREFRSRIQEGGVAMVYYSGHGAQADGINYLVPVGADIQSTGELKARGYDADILVSEMTEAKSDVNILVLDACRNNPFLSHRGSSGGLATMTASKGTIIAFATSPGNVADDNGRAQNGLYTHYLKSYITRKGMKIEDVFKRVRADVLKVNPRQIPWESSSLIGDFCLAGCEESSAAAPAGDTKPESPQASPSPLKAIDTGSSSTVTSLDLQRGRCFIGTDGSYQCVAPSRWETLGRPNLNVAVDLRGEATETLFCATLPGENADDNRCMSKEEAVKALKRCVPSGETAWTCHSVEYWLKSILDSNLSGTMATQAYTNEPFDKPDLYACTSEGQETLICLKRPPVDVAPSP
jgi:Caspase domain